MTGGETESINLKKLFTFIDAMDLESFLSFISKDGTFRFGSAPAVVGHDAIQDVVGGFFESIAGLRHVLKRTIVSGSTIICEGEVTYTRLDDSSITLPFTNIFEVSSGVISEYKIYIDITPLYAD
jgi:limonene-1,2-epoxide hydrolase